MPQGSVSGLAIGMNQMSFNVIRDSLTCSCIKYMKYIVCDI